jgi:hypothetical protein
MPEGTLVGLWSGLRSAELPPRREEIRRLVGEPGVPVSGDQQSGSKSPSAPARRKRASV